jgi:hypothetical protein
VDPSNTRRRWQFSKSLSNTQVRGFALIGVLECRNSGKIGFGIMHPKKKESKTTSMH